MTNREAIYTVKRMLRESNADNRFTNKMIYSILLKHTKWLIQRESEKLKLINKGNLFQTKKCIPVAPSPITDKCCNVQTDCTIYRTVEKIPEMFEDLYGPIILSVTSLDFSKSFNVVPPQSISRLKNNPWSKLNKKNKKYYAFYNDGYIYFPFDVLKSVNVSGMFINKVKSDCEEPCKDCNPCLRFLDQQFNIPDYLEAQMFDFTIKDLLNTYKRFPEKSHEINKNDNSPN